jgi:hypothetical protein
VFSILYDCQTQSYLNYRRNRDNKETETRTNQIKRANKIRGTKTLQNKTRIKEYNIDQIINEHRAKRRESRKKKQLGSN